MGCSGLPNKLVYAGKAGVYFYSTGFSDSYFYPNNPPLGLPTDISLGFEPNKPPAGAGNDFAPNTFYVYSGGFCSFCEEGVLAGF